MDNKIKTGRNIVIGVIAFLIFTVIAQQDDQFSIQITRIIIVGIISHSLYSGHNWARILTGFYGVSLFIIVLTDILLVTHVSALEWYQWIFLIGYAFLPFLMFLKLGVKEYQMTKSTMV